MKRRINGLTIIGIVMVCVFLGHLLTKLLERGDIWWTPKELALSLEESKDRVRVYLRGEPIEDRLRDGSLYIEDGEGRREVTQADVGIRLNNWDRQRASLYGGAIIDAAALTAGLMFLIFGALVLPAMQRKENTPDVAVNVGERDNEKGDQSRS